MKIDIKYKDQEIAESFKDVKIGEVFLWDEIPCIRITSCIHDSKEFNSVSLRVGNLFFIENYNTITRPKQVIHEWLME